MRTIFIDFETYYDREYSLTKLSVPEYVRDQRFKILGCAVAEDDGPLQWVDDLKRLPLDRARVVAHNMPFDGLVLTEGMGLKAKEYACTVALSRYHALPSKSFSLREVAKHLGLREKLDGLTEGSDKVDDRLVTYALRDVELCREIWRRLEAGMPERERRLMHITLRHSVEGRFKLNRQVLKEALAEAQERRQKAIEDSGLTEEVLSSNDQFADWMRSVGIKVPHKISKTTGKMTPALAKNDPQFVDLRMKHPEHEAVWKGRIAAKSVGEIRRLERFINIAEGGDGTLPGALNYWGAIQTGRWSGASKINLQNLPNGSALRRALTAPDGYLIGAVDLAQIELRVCLWFAGETELLKLLAEGQDLYRIMAAEIFRVTPDEVTKQQRAVAKAVVLGAQYSMSPGTFKMYLAGGPLGMEPMFITDEQAEHIVSTYRRKVSKIVALWRMMDNVAWRMLQPDLDITLHGWRFRHERAINQAGNTLWYHNLRVDSTDGGLIFRDGKKLYGGKLMQNCVQNMAREIIADKVIEIDKRFPVLLTVHDEVLFLVPEEAKAEAEREIMEVMKVPPSWAPDLPLDSELVIDRHYAK